MYAIEARSLTKKYDQLTAVDAVDFTVKENECFGFLGPNGAGKTSVVRMISCFSPVTGGSLRVFNLDVSVSPREIKGQIGVIPQEDNLDPALTVLENLVVYASFFRIPKREALVRAQELLAFMELEEKAKSLVEHLSGGMKRRLTIARAMINRPRLIILDEPTTGLDPQARHLVWQRLRQLKLSGTTLILTTHYMEEASQLCDRLVIMDRGKILEEDDPRYLVERYIGKEVLELGMKGEERDQALDQLHNHINGFQVIGDTVWVYPRDGQEALRIIQGMPVKPQHLLLRPATLEDVFLKLAGRGLDEE
ncbi:MAG: ABC transporter ATP-binding protein [Bacillota bacterium]